MNTSYYSDAQQHYTEAGLWQAISRHAKRLGESALEKVLMLYYAAQKPGVPVRAKAVIYGALGYLIWLPDAIPDLVPGVGLSDDISVLVGALATISFYIDEEVKDQARQKLRDWFD